MRTASGLLLTAALLACEGPMGPPGAPGPGTRLVLDSTVDEFGEALVDLPAEAGTLASPPAVSCYISSTGDVWLIVGIDTDGTSLLTVCVLGTSGTGSNLAVGIVGAPTGWRFRVVVVY
jgi:hypothetical protein